jgi:hypothetical protein
MKKMGTDNCGQRIHATIPNAQGPLTSADVANVRAVPCKLQSQGGADSFPPEAFLARHIARFAWVSSTVTLDHSAGYPLFCNFMETLVSVFGD